MKKIAYIELYVSNLHLTLDYYKTIFQFIPLAYLKKNDQSSILIQHSSIHLILTSSSNPKSQISQFIALHGDGVKDIAFLTEDVYKQFNLAIKNNSNAILEPTEYQTVDDTILKATVNGVGDTTHTFIQRHKTNSVALPFFQPITIPQIPTQTIIEYIDHIAICVNQGEMDFWIKHYQATYGFHVSHKEYVETEHSAMNSSVVQSQNGQIKIVLTEPAVGKKPSQIEQFIKYFGGSGVQHIAFSTNDILSTNQALQNAGIKWLTIPDEYYEIQKNKIHKCNYEFDLLRNYSILVDKSDSGFLYQAFSKPIGDKPTLFFEIIQRIKCDGFGSNNIKTLFQAVEKEQVQYEHKQTK